MAATPPLAQSLSMEAKDALEATRLQIAGNHGPVYEAYFRQADPNGAGSIGALDAATFLKKSGLQDTVLSKIWDLSDPTGKGYLEKTGFYVALKLVALSQNNRELSMGNLTEELPQPNLGPVEIAKESPSPAAGGGSNVSWTITASEKMKYNQVFDNLQPVNGLLSGDKVKPVLMNSNLPVETLGRIWDLSDIDKDGFLDRDEFSVAMHLVYKAMEKEPVPQTLPPGLIPPSKRKNVPVGAVPVLPGIMGRSSPVQRSASPALGVPWVVSAVDKVNFDTMFKKADLDMDGFVSGEEIKTIFLQSGLPNTVLAHIWNLCDTKSIGKLNSEQFALAIYLLQQKLKGVDPPASLTPEMVPPSMRPKTSADTTAFGVTDGVNAGPYSHVADTSAMKELDIITKEIEDMKREKMHLERDNAQKDADIKILNGEVQMSQKELDAITATLQQLESQKKEAQKRLDELDEKKSSLESSARDYREKCEAEQKKVNDLRVLLSNQEQSVQNQEKELEKLRVELSSLREEETQLEQKVEGGKQQLESLVKSLKDIQLQVSQTRSRVQHLEDQQRGIKQSVGSYSSSLNGEVSSIFSNQTDDQLSTLATRGGSPVSTLSNFSTGSIMDEFKDDPFKGKDPFGSSKPESTQKDPFQNEDPFKGSDPFKGEDFSSDPFASEDPFKNAFEGGSTSSGAKQSDPFSSLDPFGSPFGSSSPAKQSADPFDPFGSGSGGGKTSKPDNLFGGDPFSMKSPARSSSKKDSSAPSLPPKQKKMPPPRPAPPKGRPTPSPSKQQDGFGAFDSDPFGGNDPFASSKGSNSSSGVDPFANFADFSPSKFDAEGNDSAWGQTDSTDASWQQGFGTTDDSEA